MSSKRYQTASSLNRQYSWTHSNERHETEQTSSTQLTVCIRESTHTVETLTRSLSPLNKQQVLQYWSATQRPRISRTDWNVL